jgi:hypothetical protein
MLIALGAPYVFIGLLLASYNLARFGSVTEFGTTYQLAGYDMPKYPVYRLGYVWPNVKDYLFAFPRLEPVWPYLHLKRVSLIGPIQPHTNEPVAGALWLFPSVTIGFGLVAARFRQLVQRMPGLVTIAAVGLGVSLLVLLAVSVPFNSSTMRYEIDFVPLVVIGVVVLVGGALATSPCSRRTLALGSVWLASVGVSAMAGVALVLTRCPGTGSC